MKINHLHRLSAYINEYIVCSGNGTKIHRKEFEEIVDNTMKYISNTLF